MKCLRDYRKVVGDQMISEIYRKTLKISRKHIVQVNSTYQGGGVAEILHSLISLMNDVGVNTGWRILHGNADFFNVTKKIHNSLQGNQINFSKIKRQLYEDNNEAFARFTHIDHDLVVIHDPQPLPLINFQRKHQPWVWRCHIDISNPDPSVWDYLKGFILKYDMVIISDEKFRRPDLPVPQKIIYPSIDPLSPKNMDLSPELIQKMLGKFGIPTDKPLITQISRFDPWKDPEGVIKVFEMVKEKVDCRLILCGNMAADDPEGMVIYNKVRQKAEKYLKKKDIIMITAENHILVNVLQRISNVIIQKSIREGFGLTVSEALWKGTPVVASMIGGIPNQIQDGETGFLLQPHDYKGYAEKIIWLLQHPDEARAMGVRGKEYVRENFLTTRHLLDYLDLINEFF